AFEIVAVWGVISVWTGLTPPGTGSSIAAAGSVSIFTLAWLGMWTIAGIAMVGGFCWMLAGRETIRIDLETITIGRWAGWGRAKTYRRSDAHHLVAWSPERRRHEYPARRGGSTVGWPLSFRYGGKTVRFGN